MIQNFPDPSAIEVEWVECDLPGFNEFPFNTSDRDEGALNRQVFLSLRRFSLSDVVSKVIEAWPLATVAHGSNNRALKAFLFFTIVCIVNPFQLRSLQGDGLKPLINRAKKNSKTGESSIGLEECIAFLNEHCINPRLINWLEETGFIRIDSGEVHFCQKLASGKLVVTATQ